MKTILITGAGRNGVTGRLVKEYFQTRYDVLAPNSQELDLTDSVAVEHFFSLHHIDYVIHCATFRPSSIHANESGVDEMVMNMRMFLSLAQQRDKYKKMIYLGSGAEYDKRRNIIFASESQIGDSIPADKYGLGKYLMNEIARQSEGKIINLRLFGTINRYERPNKNVISNICAKVAADLPVILRQDCNFSFVPMTSVIRVMEYAMQNDMLYADYNVVAPRSFRISEIADIIRKYAGKDVPITFRNTELGYEYTAKNERLSKEFDCQMDVLRAIEDVYDYIQSNVSELDLDTIDSRWK